LIGPAHRFLGYCRNCSTFRIATLCDNACLSGGACAY
jgi:hypothetical protein